MLPDYDRNILPSYLESIRISFQGLLSIIYDKRPVHRGLVGFGLVGGDGKLVLSAHIDGDGAPFFRGTSRSL
jgi:hypothetical protein